MAKHLMHLTNEQHQQLARDLTQASKLIYSAYEIVGIVFPMNHPASRKLFDIISTGQGSIGDALSALDDEFYKDHANRDAVSPYYNQEARQ